MPPGQPTPSQIPPLPCHHRCREPPMLSCHSLYRQKLSPLHRAAKAYLIGGPPLLHRHHCKPKQPPSSHSLSCRRVVAIRRAAIKAYFVRDPPPPRHRHWPNTTSPTPLGAAIALNIAHSTPPSRAINIRHPLSHHQTHITISLTDSQSMRARGMLNSEGLISSTQISLYLITLLRDSKALHMFFFRGLVGGI